MPGMLSPTAEATWVELCHIGPWRERLLVAGVETFGRQRRHSIEQQIVA
jgi:hypothetical protein